MEKNHHQQPFDFFNGFSETQPPNEENYINYKVQESSSSANIVVSTELSLSSTFYSSSSSKTETKHTHQYFSGSKRNTNRKRKSSKPNNKPSSSNIEKEKTKSFNNNRQSRGYSTTLKLYDDPWKIKKVLTASDLGKLNRLLLSSDLTENFVPVLGNDHNNIEELLIEGKAVRVWDVETMSMHELILKRWASFKNYVLIGDWNQDFVKRRALKKGDEIGLQWDSYSHNFIFSVLKRVLMQ